MKVLYLNFANQQTAPLPALLAEADGIRKTLAKRQLQQHYLLEIDNYATTQKIAEYLVLYRHHLLMFAFSGHAGRDRLLLQDQTAQAAGIAHLLGQCTQLKLVLLNGCSTKGQVEDLLAVGVPIVVATSAPVEDEKASRFAQRFFQALHEQASISEAFELAIGEVLTLEKVEVTRGLLLENKKTDAPLWGIYYRPENEAALQEGLPTHNSIETPEDFQPNERLTAVLWESLIPHNRRIRNLQEEAEEYGEDIPDGDKHVQILNALPRPIAEHLRKLMAPVESENEGYDKVNANRLGQIATAFSTSMEFVSYVLMAQIWQTAIEQAEQVDIPKSLLEQIQHYLHLGSQEKVTYDFVPMIQALDINLQANKVDYFVAELRGIAQLLETEEVQSALVFLNILRKKLQQDSIAPYEVPALCIRAEDSLAALLKHFCFFTKYTLAAIKSIDVLRYRHLKETQFSHNMVKLMRVFGKLQEDTLDINRSLFNRSVLLLKKQPKADKNDTQELCLSPFIIDENAFDLKTDLSKLYFFSHYKEKAEVYCYKHINRPSDPLLEVSKEKYELIKTQFDTFKALL